MRWAMLVLLGSVLCTGCSKSDSGSQTNAPAFESTPAASSDTTSTSASATAAPATTENVELKILTHDEILALIASHQGKVVVVDAWSTACPPCIQEFPNLVALHNELQDQVACVSLSFDYEGIDQPEDQYDRVHAFLKKQQATFDNVLNKEESDVLTRKMKISSIPAVFVYDQAGNLHQTFDSSFESETSDHFTYADIRATINKLLQAEGS